MGALKERCYCLTYWRYFFPFNSLHRSDSQFFFAYRFIVQANKYLKYSIKSGRLLIAQPEIGLMTASYAGLQQTVKKTAAPPCKTNIFFKYSIDEKKVCRGELGILFTGGQ